MGSCRKAGTRSYQDVLERILDRGVVVDGLSHIAAAMDDAPLSAQADATDPTEQQIPTCMLAPPRIRDRD